MRERAPRRRNDKIGARRLGADCSRAERRECRGGERHCSPRRELLSPFRTVRAPGRFVGVAGSASCARDGKDVARFDPGDFFVGVALLDHRARTAPISREAPMRVLVFNHRELSRPALGTTGHTSVAPWRGAARELHARGTARLFTNLAGPARHRTSMPLVSGLCFGPR